MRKTLLSVALAAFLPFVGVAGAEVLPGCLALKGHEQEFRRTTVEWRGDVQGDTVLVYAVVNVEDKATVCGMYMNRGAVPLDMLNHMLATGKITSGRQVLVGNLSYFRNACKDGRCRLCAPCYMTPLDWKTVYGRTKPKFVPGVDVPAR